MKIAEALKIAIESHERYKSLDEQGKGKNMAKKIELVDDHIARLTDMQYGGRSPWHDYSDLIAIYEIDDFVGKTINV